MTAPDITLHADGSTTYAGPDAVALYRARYIAHALEAATRGMRLSAKVTPAAALRAASSITGKRYPRGAYRDAAADVRLWCATMTAALEIAQEV